MSEKTKKAGNEETEDASYNWLRGNIRHYRELKKRLGDMFTKKQQTYLDKLESYAKEENIEIVE